MVFERETNRKNDFEMIKTVLASSLKLSTKDLLLAKGDSLNLLKSLPDNSVSLILTDPPYHSTQKKNIGGDTRFKKDSDYIEWIKEYSEEWHRVLRPNGSLFCFCASDLSARLEAAFSEKFNTLSHIVWTKPNEPGFDGWKQKMKKEALRQWYAHSERIIFAEPSYEGNIFYSFFGVLLRKMRKKSGLSMHQLTEMTGAYGKVNHGGAVSNWEAARNTPNKEQYQKICEALSSVNRDIKMPEYEDVIRPFKTNGNDQFTDIWDFPNVRPYKGKHPAEKPLELLKHAIKSTTHKGDIVLDCFSGSGNTAVSALSLGRLAVLMEMDNKWVEASKKRLKTRQKTL